ncbi:MAG: 50S ribosomal protein L29 [Candidatus Omnitrophica bacterium]|nr:50S ribosomal protein L29 [Candidatus Omnitrophota bacterium]MCM8824873.1 50S ribosomal protein L29 [Candidatus Omnitrophota bacterium]
MKKSELNELKDLTIKELEQKRNDVAKRLFEQRIQVRLGQLKNTHILRNLRKEIAQINTLIQQKKKNERGANDSREKKNN